MIIYPQLGWQEEVEIPASIIHAYFFLNNKGFDKFIYSSSEILELVKKHKPNLQEPNLFFNIKKIDSFTIDYLL